MQRTICKSPDRGTRRQSLSRGPICRATSLQARFCFRLRPRSCSTLLPARVRERDGREAGPVFYLPLFHYATYTTIATKPFHPHPHPSPYTDCTTYPDHTQTRRVPQDSERAHSLARSCTHERPSLLRPASASATAPLCSSPFKTRTHPTPLRFHTSSSQFLFFFFFLFFYFLFVCCFFFFVDLGRSTSTKYDGQHTAPSLLLTGSPSSLGHRSFPGLDREISLQPPAPGTIRGAN